VAAIIMKFVVCNLVTCIFLQNLAEKLLKTLKEKKLANSELVSEIFDTLRHFSREKNIVDNCLKKPDVYSLLLKHANLQNSGVDGRFKFGKFCNICYSMCAAVCVMCINLLHIQQTTLKCLSKLRCMLQNA